MNGDYSHEGCDCRKQQGIGRGLIVFIVVALLVMMLASVLTGCGSTANQRTTTIAPDGTQTIVENLDPFVMLQTKCLERKFE